MCTKSMKLKQKWYSSNDYSEKWSFYGVVTWKLLFSGGGINFRWGKKILVGESTGRIFLGGENEHVLLVGMGSPSIPPVGKTLSSFKFSNMNTMYFYQA